MSHNSLITLHKNNGALVQRSGRIWVYSSFGCLLTAWSESFCQALWAKFKCVSELAVVKTACLLEGNNQLQENNGSGSFQPSNYEEMMAWDLQNDEGSSFPGVISPYRILALCPCRQAEEPPLFLKHWSPQLLIKLILRCKHQYEPKLNILCLCFSRYCPS